MKQFHFRGRTRWLVIPLVAWAIAEVAIGKFFSRNLRWYEAAEADLRTGPPVQAIFIGSSRVNAAIDAASAEKEATRLFGKPYRVLNLGYGNTNLTEHYLGLRYLFEKHPEQLRDVTVFIEASGGLPEYRNWQEPWVAGNLSATLPYLKSSDLGDIWRTEDSFENKMEVTLRFATRWSNVMARKDKVQQYAFMVNDSVIAPQLAPHPATSGDLTSEGGIRADDEGIKEARALAIKTSADQMSRPQPKIEEWGNRVVASLVQFIHNKGGRVVFFQVPLSSVMGAPFQTDTMKENARIFGQTAEQWGASMVKTSVQTKDIDFPDLWHMRRSLAPEFTKGLMDAYAGREVQ